MQADEALLMHILIFIIDYDKLIKSCLQMYLFYHLQKYKSSIRLFLFAQK